MPDLSTNLPVVVFFAFLATTFLQVFLAAATFADSLSVIWCLRCHHCICRLLRRLGKSFHNSTFWISSLCSPCRPQFLCFMSNPFSLSIIFMGFLLYSFFHIRFRLLQLWGIGLKVCALQSLFLVLLRPIQSSSVVFHLCAPVNIYRYLSSAFRMICNLNPKNHITVITIATVPWLKPPNG